MYITNIKPKPEYRAPLLPPKAERPPLPPLPPLFRCLCVNQVEEEIICRQPTLSFVKPNYATCPPFKTKSDSYLVLITVCTIGP